MTYTARGKLEGSNTIVELVNRISPKNLVLATSAEEEKQQADPLEGRLPNSPETSDFQGNTGFSLTSP